MPDDLPALYRLVVGGSSGDRLRYQGATPSFGEFAEHAYDAVHVQHVVELQPDGPVVGLVVLSTVDFTVGTGHFSVVLDDACAGSGLGVMASILFLNYVFSRWDLRKVAVEVADQNLGSFASLEGKLLQREGVRQRHVYWMGDYVDLHLFAIWRHALEEVVPTMLPRSWVG